MHVTKKSDPCPQFPLRTRDLQPGKLYERMNGDIFICLPLNDCGDVGIYKLWPEQYKCIYDNRTCCQASRFREYKGSITLSN